VKIGYVKVVLAETAGAGGLAAAPVSRAVMQGILLWVFLPQNGTGPDTHISPIPAYQPGSV